MIKFVENLINRIKPVQKFDVEMHVRLTLEDQKPKSIGEFHVTVDAKSQKGARLRAIQVLDLKAVQAKVVKEIKPTDNPEMKVAKN